MAVKKGRVVTVTSVKGGVGKTTFLLSLASIIKGKVLVVDFDMHTNAIGTSLSLSFHNTIADALLDLEYHRFTGIKNYITNYQGKFDVLLAPNDPRQAVQINTNYLKPLLEQLQMQYDLILVDTNHLLDKNNLTLFDYSDELLYLFTPNLIDLKSMMSMMNIYEKLGKENYYLILNRSFERNGNYDDNEIRFLLKDNFDYTIEKDYSQKNYENYLLDGKIIKPTKVFNKISQTLEGELL